MSERTYVCDCDCDAKVTMRVCTPDKRRSATFTIDANVTLGSLSLSRKSVAKLAAQIKDWLEETTPAGGYPAGSKPAPGKHAPHRPPPRDVRGLSGVPGEAGVSFSESEGPA